MSAVLEPWSLVMDLVTGEAATLLTRYDGGRLYRLSTGAMRSGDQLRDLRISTAPWDQMGWREAQSRGQA